MASTVDPKLIGGFQVQIEESADGLERECDTELQNSALDPLLCRLFERAKQLSAIQFPTFPNEDDEF